MMVEITMKPIKHFHHLLSRPVSVKILSKKTFFALDIDMQFNVFNCINN